MLPSTTHDGRYVERREQLSEYFGATAAASWAALTSDAPTNFVRRAVRAGREEMRQHMVSWLPARLDGLRVLDAGCGTGGLSIEVARRGATVLGVDVADAMIAIARDRTPAAVANRVTFVTGDMLDGAFGTFDHVVAMDSLIHYAGDDMVGAIRALAERTRVSLCFTVAPRTPALVARHALGRLFPRRNRSPEINPVPTERVKHEIGSALGNTFRVRREARVATGFYVSQGIELVRGTPEQLHDRRIGV